MTIRRFLTVLLTTVALGIALTGVSCTAPEPAAVPTPTSAPTDTPPPTATVAPPAPTATATPEPTLTSTPIPPTHTPAPTFTPKPRPTATLRPTPTSTPGPTRTPRPTSTPRPPNPIAGLQNDRWIERNDPRLATAIKELPWVVDGVTDLEREALQQLLWIAWTEKNHAWNLLRTPWLEDGPDVNEIDAIERLNWTTQTFPELADKLWQASWMQDDITADEVTVMQNLDWIARAEDDAFQEQTIAAAIAILGMPFLNSVESVDALAVRSLEMLAWNNTGDFLEIMSHPKISDGISDEEAKIVALLGGTHRYRPKSVDFLLRGAGVFVEERVIELPHSGETLLAIIRIRDKVTPSMDFLEHSVRTIEEFMAEPLPTNYIALFFDDATVGGTSGGTNYGTHMTMLLLYDVENGRLWKRTPLVIAHEVAHYYWRGSSRDWLDEGPADLIALISENARIERPIEVDNNPCASAKTIAELESLAVALETWAATVKANWFRCNYSLGEAFFLDLYNNLGEETFRQGFRNLYLKSLRDDATDDCEGTDLGICHLVAAFKADVSDEVAATVDEIVGRWYGPVP